MHVISVADLVHHLQALLSSDYGLHDVWVQGEITNFTQSPAGHRYFSLKDESYQVRCVFFARRGLDPSPPLRNGMQVLVHGRMSIYEARGDLQLNVDSVQDAGVGLLHLRFEELKRQLEAEGLFASARKRPIPACPATIGVVTSTATAALRDIVRTLRDRWPLARVIVAPAQVQGVGAAEQVAAALDLLNAHGEAEVAIVARGGGSLEELWAFNEEVVARAIYRSRIPIVTGVGHETDFTIADFVADDRQPTPTAAAARVVPDIHTRYQLLDDAAVGLDDVAFRFLVGRRQLLEQMAQRLGYREPAARLTHTRQRLDAVTAALGTQMRHLVERQSERLSAKVLQLESLSPQATLQRGFAIVRVRPAGDLLTSVGQVSPGAELAITLADGTLATTVDGARGATTGRSAHGDTLEGIAADADAEQVLVPERLASGSTRPTSRSSTPLRSSQAE